MQIKVQEEIRQQPALAAKVEQLNKMMVAHIGPSPFSGDVRAEWTLPGMPPKEKEVKLQMSSADGSVERSFSAVELASLYVTMSRILSLWFHLLQAKSDKHQQRIKQLIAQMEAEEEE
jgi:hypothetical protein